MRVKEGVTNNSEMGKKKKSKSADYHNTSDEETQKSKGCSHKDTSVNFNGVKKCLKNTSSPLGTCTQCLSPGKKATADEDTSEGLFEPTVWICLQCGHQGCDRNSRDKHAVSHYETPRSANHALALSLVTWQVWCYKCDEEVPYSDWKKLTECADWLKKQLGVSKSESTFGFSSKKKSKDKDSERDEAGRNKTTIALGEKHSTKVKGLVNLGNTCFFNAVMQNLTQTHVLRSVLSEKWTQGKQVNVPLDTNLELGTNNEDDKIEDETDENSHLLVTLPSMGTLTSALLGFLEDMNKESKSSSVNPRPLFSEVCQKAARFKGYQQQDSHELLRYLLDSMKIEQIKRIQEGILHAFNLKGEKEKVKLNKLDENTKRKIREYGMKGKMTFVDGVFGGYLISSVKCQVCNTVSEILEPFLDLSLPILEAKGSKKGVIGGKNPERPQTLAEQAKLAEPESVDLPSPGAVATPKISKYQQQKAREKARKDIKKRNRKSRSHSQGSEKCPEQSEERDSGSHSDDDGRDPNDADSETSMMDKNGSNQNDDGTATEDTLESGNLTDTVTMETSGIKESNGKDATECVTNVKPKDENIVEDGAKLKGGSNSEQKYSEEEPAAKNLGDMTKKEIKQGGSNGDRRHSEEELAVKDSENETKKEIKPESSNADFKYVDEKSAVNDLENVTNKEIKQGDDVISELTSELSSLKLNSTPNGDSQECKGGESICSGERTDWLESVQFNSTPNHDSKTEGDSTPTNVSSKSPAVQKKHKKPPPLIAPPPAPISSVMSKMSPPLSPLSPSIKAKATSPLGPRYQSKSQECSVQSCLSQFTSPEWLTGANKFGCENCTSKKGKDADGKSKTQYTDASKQLLIHHPPPVLTLHLKRFQQVGYNLRKITRHIDFPLVLDISPFCSESCQDFANKDGQVLYALYGIVEHSGRLQFGHYTSFIKLRQPSQMLYLHTIKIPRGLNLIQASCSKKILGAEKKRHQKNNSPSESLALHSQPNGILPVGEHGIEPDSQTTQVGSNTSNHIGGNTLENGSGVSVQFPLASGDKESNPQGKWYYISDTHVSEASEGKVLSAQAYLLFYERIL